MLNLIGWGRTTSDSFSLQSYITFSGTYELTSVIPWSPQPGDVFVDSNGLSDTVVSVDANNPLLFNGISNHIAWATGFATITRKTSSVPANKVEFLGIARAFDNLIAQRTDLVLNSGNIIEDNLTTVGAYYEPPGFAYASVVEIAPQSASIGIANASYFAPQGLKVLVNTHPTNRFVIGNNLPFIPRTTIFTLTGSDIIVDPGESVALIRDTQDPNNPFWRAGRNSPLVP